MSMFFLFFMLIFQIIVKLLLLFFQLFKIDKNIQDTLSLCVTRSGTKKPGTTYSCTRLLSTGGSPMSFMSFVNFSQFNLDFHEFRNCLMLIFMNSFLLKKQQSPSPGNCCFLSPAFFQLCRFSFHCNRCCSCKQDAHAENQIDTCTDIFCFRRSNCCNVFFCYNVG